MLITTGIYVAASDPYVDFALIEGTVRTYEVSTSEGTSVKDVVVVRCEGAWRRPVFEFKGKSFDHLGADAGGLYRYAPAHMDGSGFARSRNPELILRTPAKPGDAWKWVRPFQGQVMSDANGKGPDPEKLKSDVTATVIAVDEPVRWADHGSRAIHVRMTSIRRDGEKSVTDSWYVKSLGLVRERETVGRSWTEKKLLKYDLRAAISKAKRR